MDKLEMAVERARSALSGVGEAANGLQVKADSLAVKTRPHIDRLAELGDFLNQAVSVGKEDINEALNALDGIIAYRLTDSTEASDELEEAVLKAVEDLQAAFIDFDETTRGLIEALHSGLHVQMDALGVKITALNDIVSDQVSETVETLAQRTAEKFAETLGETQITLVDEIEGLLRTTLGDIESLAEEVGDQANQRISDAWSELRTDVEQRFRDLLEDQVDQIGQTVISATAQQVVEDMALTQLSATVTSAMSAQLPQLATAKAVVGSVRALLEAMP